MEKLTARLWAQTMWQPSTWNKSKLVTRVKPRANGRNIVGQLLPTLLDVTGSVRLHTLLHVATCRLRVVGSCCEKVGNRSNFSANPPTLLEELCKQIQHTLRYVLGITEQRKCKDPNLSFVPWSPKRSATYVVSVCTALPTMLGPRMRITHGLQSLMVCILSTMHGRSQQYSLGSCCIRHGIWFPRYFYPGRSFIRLDGGCV